jgi:hypothetical protein
MPSLTLNSRAGPQIACSKGQATWGACAKRSLQINSGLLGGTLPLKQVPDVCVALEQKTLPWFRQKVEQIWVRPVVKSSRWATEVAARMDADFKIIAIF